MRWPFFLNREIFNRDASLPDLRKFPLFALLSTLALLAGCGKISVSTYHNDTLRTGWNEFENHLTHANVNSTSLTAVSVVLDDEVDTQPLIVPNVHITAGNHKGKHDVVYVATEHNTIYAINASSGQILLNPNFGPPVPILTNPAVPAFNCGNNGPNIGINGTPVIDSVSRTMYVVVYTFEDNKPVYRIHALDIGNLTDKIPPVTVSATHTLSDGSVDYFDPAWQRQRPGLLLANGNVYVGFGSFCDWGHYRARGWVLGWKQGTLSPLPMNQLNDKRPSNNSDLFLSSIWMSGYGLAADPSGNLFFITGNSDYASYDGAINIQESVVRLNPDLSMAPPPPPPAPNPSLFTPADVNNLDGGDTDFGSGGVMLLPAQASAPGDLAIAAGKDARMFLLNRDNLGGFTSNNAGALDTVNIGPCWCGQSYFYDGTPHVVSSGGNQVIEWDLQLPQHKLLQIASSASLPTGGDLGFFTSVSSWGSANPIIWAVSHPDSQHVVTLYAFNGTPSGGTLATLFQAPAGTWPYGGNANIVPVVANGKIYVASYQKLLIFGHHRHAGKKAEELKFVAEEKIQPPLPSGSHIVFATVRHVDGSRVTAQTRDGKELIIDTTPALQSSRVITLVPGRVIQAMGVYDNKGTLKADSIQRAKATSAEWPADR
ncbi:MAG: hypothetical protein ACYDCG_20435 [Candidatus Acidiferrales bacterium]